MRQLLKELGIAEGADLGTVIDRAWQVHQKRGDADEVTPSSVVYAAVTLNPAIRVALERSGLRFREWEKSLGLARQPIDFPPPVRSPPYRVHSDLRYALGTYAKNMPKRPLDSIGLVTALSCA